MKTTAKIFCAVFVAVLCALFLPACSPSDSFSTPSYTITDYSVTAVISEDNVYTKSNESQATIYFGDSDKLVDGNQIYRFSYKLHFATDGTLGFNGVCYNIVGSGWPVTIEKMNFPVTLPKEFDADTLGFSVGYSGTRELAYTVEGNTTRGEVLRKLYPNDVRRTDWIVMSCMGLLVFIAFIIFLVVGRDKKPVETVEFYPPNGLTPAEIGYVYDGVVDTRDQASMLLSWADKGCLSIDVTGGNYVLTKLRELGEDAKPFERHMFRALFSMGSVITPAQSRLFMTMFDVQRMITASFGRAASPFTKESLRMQRVLSFMAWLPLVVTLTMSISTLGEGWWFGILMGLIASTVLILPLLPAIHLLREWNSRKRSWLKFGLLLAVFIGLNVFYAVVAAPTFMDPLRPVAAALSALFIAFLSGFIRKRTDEGSALMGRILGFKNFIERAEKDKIERLVKKNPGYFYNILPYAYVLNVTDQWIYYFEGMLYSPPAGSRERRISRRSCSCGTWTAQWPLSRRA